MLGQILPGVSVWQLSARDGRDILYVVVPGNVGEPDTLTRILQALHVSPHHDELPLIRPTTTPRPPRAPYPRGKQCDQPRPAAQGTKTRVPARVTSMATTCPGRTQDGALFQKPSEV